MFYILLNNSTDRIILAMTQKNPRPPEWNTLKAEHNAIEVSVANEPTNFRDHRRLSADNTTCEDVDESVIEDRRAQVIAWAGRVAPPALGLRVAVESSFSATAPASAIRTAWIFHCVAAAGSDQVLENDAAWAELQANMKVNMGALERTITQRRAAWDAILTKLTTLRGFYKIERGNPALSTNILWPSVEAGQPFANEVMYGGRA